MDIAESQELLTETPKSLVAPESVFAVVGLPRSRSQRTVWKLYCSHALSKWGERMWEFASGLVLLKLNEDSLFLVSTQGLVSGIAVVVMGGCVGSVIDRVDRLEVACNMYMLQNLSLAISGGCALAAFLIDNNIATSILVVLVIGFSAVSGVASLGSTLSVEKEWTKQLCELDSDWLAQINAGMRGIDMVCLILSPVLVGSLMTYVSVPAAIAVIVAWNCLAWAPECLLLKSAYRHCDVLREAKGVEPSQAVGAKGGWHQFAGSVKAYFQQPTVFAGLSLALLYLTVMSFGILMTAYLNWNGMPEAELSLYRGLGALTGISGAVIFLPMQRKFGLDLTAGCGIWFQFCSLLVAAIPILLRQWVTVSSVAALRTLVWGLIMSRLGLWLFDLCVMQMLQDRVDRAALGAINGVQGSLMSIFSTVSYSVGMVLWEPNQFQYLMIGSVGVVLVAALLFTLPQLILLGCRGSKELEENEGSQEHELDIK